MRDLNYVDYLCTSVNIQVGMETLVCLKCGNSVSRVSNVRASDDNDNVGRTEDLAYTFNPTIVKPLSQELLLSLIKEYYKDLFYDLSIKIFNSNWVTGLELVVWEVVEDGTLLRNLHVYEEIKQIKMLFERTGLWPVNTAHWLNFKDSDDVVFVNATVWKYMLKKKQKLLKNTVDELDTGIP
jgi:hypothetical protein